MAIKISGTTVIDNSQNITNAGIVTATSFTGDGSQLTNLPGGGGNTLEATASGTLADGSKVIVNTDGTVSVVAQTETTGAGDSGATTFTSHNTDYITGVFDSNSNRVVLFYRVNDGSPGKGSALVGEISGGSVTFGSPVDFETDATVEIDAAFDSTNNKVVVGYRRYASNGTKYHHARVGTVDPSNNSITFGTREVINSNGESAYFNMIFDPSSGKIVVAYADESNSFRGTARVGTVSGTSISFGTALLYNSNFSSNVGEMVADTSANRIVLVSTDVISGSYKTVVRVGTVSGTSISFSSPQEIYASSSSNMGIGFDASTNKVVVVYQNDNSGGDAYRLNTLVGTVNAGTNTIAFGSRQTLAANSGISRKSVVYDSGSQKLLIIYRNGNNSYIREYLYATVNGGTDTITLGSATVIGTVSNGYYGAVYDSNANQSLIHYQDYANSRYGTYHIVGLSGFPVPETGSTAVFESAHADHIKAVYDSANGKVVIAYQDRDNSDYGTAVVGTVSGTSISFGTPVVFESANTSYIESTFDSTNEKVVISYRDNGNSYYGTAIVGTVSGNSISFGSPTVYHSSGQHSYTGVTFDSYNGKVVIAYTDATNQFGMVRVGTISGTSISFGSPVTFESAHTQYISATFDTTNNKVVIAYKDRDNSNYGTAIVGTVSGTSITFGSATVFESANTSYIASTFDSTNGKVVIAYTDIGNSYYGTAIVGTVSGTSISFGTPVVFESAQVLYLSAAYDSANGKVVIAYEDTGNSDKATAIVGTVSGTSISFDSPNAFVSTVQEYISAAYDSANQKVVIAFNDKANSKYGTAFTFSSRTISRNLTAENFIGISDGAYSDGQTATIQLTGAVDDAQSSLTPGQAYYVQNDGTLSTSADNPSVFAGTALASTKLIVRG